MSAGDRILVFSPHPDDLELFLGGTFLRHLSEGAAVKVLMMTSGEKASILGLIGPTWADWVRRTRAEEIRRRFALVPEVELTLMELPDRDVRQTDEAIGRSQLELEAFQPSCVYLPESVKRLTYYLHADHLAVGQIAESAAARLRPAPILRHYHSRQPNTFIDISRFHEDNLAALRCYRTQYTWHTGLPFLLRLYEPVRYVRTRSYGRKIGARFAEAFRQVG